MNKKRYPEEVTKDNVGILVDEAERIKDKAEQIRHLLVLLAAYVIPAVFMGYSSFSLMIWLAQNGYLNFLLLLPVGLAVKAFWVLLYSFMGFVLLSSGVLLLLSTIRLNEKYLGYPTYDELIFSDCFIIANHVRKNERLEAKKHVGTFLNHLKGFVRYMFFNPRRKVYSPEFDTLRSGKNEISRLLMFSEDNISRLFMDLGLAFVRSDDPKAFLSLKQLVLRVREYGEPKGRLSRLLSGIEQYPHASPVILTIIIIAIALAYYIISGQSLPIP